MRTGAFSSGESRTHRNGARAGRAALILLVSGCERIVDVDLDPGPTRLVVEGRLELIRGSPEGRQRIRLSTTDAFTSDRAPPPATGAAVAVVDEANRAVPFVESAATPGTYETAGLLPVVGARYTLRIDYQGERYEATDRVMPVPPIDSLYFRFVRDDVFGDPGFRAAIDYSDPAGGRNFYLWEQLIDGERQLLPEESNRFHVIGSDDFYDGQRIMAYQPYEETIVEPGQSVVVRQVGLSEAAFRYYFALFQQTTSHGSPFAVPPGSLRGNVANLTNPARYPLGYFWAAEVAEARAVLPAESNSVATRSFPRLRAGLKGTTLSGPRAQPASRPGDARVDTRRAGCRLGEAKEIPIPGRTPARRPRRRSRHAGFTIPTSRGSTFDDHGMALAVVGDGERYLVRASSSGIAAAYIQQWPALRGRADSTSRVGARS